MKTAVITIPLIMASVTFAMDPPEVMWERVYFPEEEYTSFKYIEEIDNGNLLATMSASISPSNAFYCLSSDGDFLWAARSDLNHQGGSVVHELPGGDFIVTGFGRVSPSSGIGLLLSKFDSSGQEIWTRLYNKAGGSEHGTDITQLPDGGYAICGDIDPTEGMDQAWVLRTDSQGDTLWTREWGWEKQDRARGILCIDNTITVLTSGRLEGDPGGTYLVRYSMDGELLHQYRIPELQGTYGMDMCEASDGGLLILTEYGPVVIAHTDYYGNVDWMFSPPAGSQPYGQSIATTMDGGIIYGGLTTPWYPNRDQNLQYSGMVTRHDSLGNELWRDYVYNSGCIAIYSVRQLSQGGYIAAGRTSSQGFLMRYAPELGVEEEGFSSGVAITGLTPNPSYGMVTVGFSLPGQGETLLRVYDLSGRLVDELAEGVFPAGEHTVTWAPSPGLSGGCYIVRVASEGVMDTETCVLLH
jgi:hypothetical protein